MKGEMCVLHRTVLKFGTESGFIMVSCRPGCPKYTLPPTPPRRR